MELDVKGCGIRPSSAGKLGAPDAVPIDTLLQACLIGGIGMGTVALPVDRTTGIRRSALSLSCGLSLDGCVVVPTDRLCGGQREAFRAWALPIQVPVSIQANKP